MSVPSNSITKSFKSSVHTKIGIGKTLLTPCRRIGLSRKPKRLQETQNTSLQENKNIYFPVGSSDMKTTTQAKGATITEAERTSDDIDSVEIQQSKKTLSKVLTTKNTTDSSDSKVTNKKSESIEWINHLQSTTVEEEQKPSAIDMDDLKQLFSKDIKVCVTRMEPLHSIKRKNAATAPRRTVKRKLSMKKSTDSHNNSSSDTDDEIGLVVKRAPSSCDIISEGATDSIDGKENIISQEGATDSIDPKENIISQGQSGEVRGKEDASSLIDEILQLEKRVHEKEAHLSKLQQAERYHNMHNVEDLERVTSDWKSKCEEALRDLLGKLKEHALLDMPTLLKNLRVPSSIISYNSDEDVFL